MTAATDLLSTLQARMAIYVAAETKILTTQQSYAVGGRSMQRAALKEVQDKIDSLQKRINQLNGTGASRIRRAVPFE